MALRARNVSGAFEKQAPGLEPGVLDLARFGDERTKHETSDIVDRRVFYDSWSNEGLTFNSCIAENAYCSRDIYLQFTKYLRSVILPIIIHQIFSLARDWSKRVTWVNIPQLKLGNIRGYSPIFKTARVA